MEIKGKTFAHVYGTLLDKLMYNPEYVSSPRGQQTKEIIDITLEIEDPTQCLYTNSRRSSQFKYVAAELIWYFAGDRSIKYIDRYAKFWKQIAYVDPYIKMDMFHPMGNDKDEIQEQYHKCIEEHVVKNGVVNSAYGDLIFKQKNEAGYSQYHWAFESLANDKDTRQAILHFNTPKHQYEFNKDFVCTLHGMFMIRDNKLNLTVNMRSNDAILGTPTDVPFFCTLLNQMYFHLKPIYPELELGSYKHQVHSMHVYEKHFDLIRDMLTHHFNAASIPNLEKSLVNMDGSPTDLTKNLFEWANDDVREPIIGMSQDNFVKFLTKYLLTDEEKED